MHSSIASFSIKTLAVLAAIGSATAANLTYTGPNMGTWNSPTVWNIGRAPIVGDSVSVVSTGTANFFVKGNTSYAAPGLASLLLNNSSGAGFVVLDYSKNLVVSGTTIVGSSGWGAIEQNGGNQSHGVLSLGDSQSTSYGEYNLMKGNLSAGDIIMGNAGSGVFNQNKGSVIVTDDLIIGNNSNFDSLYHLANGKMTIADSTIIGAAGNGYYEQYKGTADLGALVLGQTAGQTGNARQLGGTARTDSVTVGVSGTGYYTQDSGNHSIAGNLTLGSAAGGTGFYGLGNGNLDVGGKIIIGNPGQGTFSQVGGKLNVAGGVEVHAGEFHLNNATITTKGLSVAAGAKLTTEGAKPTIRTTGNISFDQNAVITTRYATLSVAKGSNITLSAIQADTGASASALSANESWNSISLDKNVTLTLEGTAGVDAVYVNTLDIGSKDPFRVESIITGNGVDMYYNADLKANKYLKGGTYDLGNGGQLIAVHTNAGTSSTGGSTISNGSLNLGGSGILVIGSGSLTISGTSTFGPGMTVDGESLTFGGSLDMDLGSGSASDTILAGDFDASGLLDFSLSPFDSSLTELGTWTFAEGNGELIFNAGLTAEVQEASGTLGEREFAPSAVPEPAAGILAILGAAALLARRRRSE